MNESDQAEVVGALVVALRGELHRQMGQFERDKLLEARVAQLAVEIGDLASAVDTRLATLKVRMTLCEGRITRLEARR